MVLSGTRHHSLFHLAFAQRVRCRGLAVGTGSLAVLTDGPAF